MNRTLAKDRNGFIPAGLLMNPWVILIIAIVVIVMAVMGGLAVLYAPNIAAAAVLLLIGMIFVWKFPGDMKIRLGVFIAFIVAAILIYFYGTSILAVIA